MHPAQLQIFKSMEPEKKLQISLQLYYSARSLKKAALQQMHPNWSEDKIEQKLRQIFLYARTESL